MTRRLPRPTIPPPGRSIQREPDDNGVDDPPVAVDDPVTARSGSSVQVQVTANDYDPDGEAIAVSSVGAARPRDGRDRDGVDVVYTPDAGYVGRDQFDYTIVDGNGTEDSATVVVELLPASATNKPPIGIADHAQTGPETPVVVEVLLNDVDPERDALRIGSFTPPDERHDRRGDRDASAPRDCPRSSSCRRPDSRERRMFSYRPVDALGGQGDDVDVRVEVAASDEANRAPVARPDAVRARRKRRYAAAGAGERRRSRRRRPDLDRGEPLPPGLDVRVQGASCRSWPRTGAADLLPFQYEISDGRGGVARGAVLVDVIDDAEPNLPPVLTADSDTVVVGQSVAIDVLANDIDPDGDPLVIVERVAATGQARPGGDRRRQGAVHAGPDRRSRRDQRPLHLHGHRRLRPRGHRRHQRVDPARVRGPTAVRPRRLDVHVHELAGDDRRAAQRR